MFRVIKNMLIVIFIFPLHFWEAIIVVCWGLGEKIFLVLLVSSVLLSFLVASLHAYVLEFDLNRAVNYLAKNYNSSYGLIPEVEGGNIFWVYSDNYLAYLVLKYFDPNNQTLVDIAENISRTLSYYSQTCDFKPLNKFNILGGSIPYFNASLTFNLTDYVRVDLNNGTDVLDPRSYGDVAFLMALYYYRLGEYKRANDYFEVGARMFDGVGINDLPYREGEAKGIYQTYKLGLYVAACKVLGKNIPNVVVERIRSLQAPNGGFFTGYYANGTIPSGVVTNTETTAIIVYAFSPQIIERFFTPQTSSSFFNFIYVILFLFLVAAVIIIIGIIKSMR
ncbi:MAG: hypothetical protein NC827_08000 [Candidatus Omnitrophica bacterium]|nr:hypothetical protein [Candidatus Omnitrophota bacterium]